MKRMFASATLKLTAWYMTILVAISLLFSVIIYELATSEISSRLERLQVRVEGSTDTVDLPGSLSLDDIRRSQTDEARVSIFVGLVYTNMAIIGVGGIGAFLLARRTLRPIEQAHDRQARFISDASHELRTPLAIMKSEIQVLLRDVSPSKAEMLEVLRSNLDEVDKLSQLSTSLLQLSRLDETAIQRTDKIQLEDMLLDTLQRFKPYDTDRFSMSFPTEPLFIEGNHSLLIELFSIIIDNAAKHGHPHTPIVLSASSDGRTCRIDVRNRSEPIPEEELDRIFDRFYQIDTARATSHKGYGLGLALARSIVSSHDGTIRMTNEPSKYVTCTVLLPTIHSNR